MLLVHDKGLPMILMASKPPNVWSSEDKKVLVVNVRGQALEQGEDDAIGLSFVARTLIPWLKVTRDTDS